LYVTRGHISIYNDKILFSGHLIKIYGKVLQKLLTVSNDDVNKKPLNLVCHNLVWKFCILRYKIYCLTSTWSSTNIDIDYNAVIAWITSTQFDYFHSQNFKSLKNKILWIRSRGVQWYMSNKLQERCPRIRL
jgi:hypothetical protein